MSETQETEFLEASDHWLEAAVWLGLSLRMTGATEVHWGAHYYLLQLSRLQYACELSYHRIKEASKIADSEDHRTAMAGIGRLYLDIHAFLVSAHAYWRTIEKLNTLLKLAELDAAIAHNQLVADETKTARDHLEHIVERIQIGRPPHFGHPMDAQTFRGAMGRFEGDQITFGDETFRLGAINTAIRNVGRAVAPALRQATIPVITVRVTEPEQESVQPGR